MLLAYPLTVLADEISNKDIVESLKSSEQDLLNEKTDTEHSVDNELPVDEAETELLDKVELDDPELERDVENEEIDKVTKDNIIEIENHRDESSSINSQNMGEQESDTQNQLAKELVLSGEEIASLKENLNKLGFSVTMNYPSSYGPKTKIAVKDFQEYYGLEPTGYADNKTLERIDVALVNSLKRNDNSIKVRELKANLNLLGFTVGMNSPNNYGPVTQRAVKLFQQSYGLRESGIADEFTLEKIEELLKTSLKQGDNSSQVKRLKENLNILTFPVSMNYPNNYGPATAEAVKKFQKHYGIQPTGVADRVTLEKIDDLINAPLALGLRRVDVLDLKQTLNKIGFHVSDNPTSYYGPVTERVVKEFQAYYGLDATGNADDTTLSKLDEVLNGSLKRNDNSEIVRKLKENLNALGFSVGMNYPDNYGPSTERAVRDFQSYYDMRETGVADEYVLEKVEILLKGSLKRNDNSPEVYKLKQNLNKLGFTVSMNYPNNYGPATERAVKEFQKYYGIHSNGIANDITLTKLKNILANSYQENQSHSEVRKLKENLNKLGFSVSMNYPKNFGPATKRAVENFQKHFGLRVTGIAEERTIDKINEILTGSLKRGSNSSAVRQLKEKLNDLGFSVTMNSPNNYGPATESAVKDFQKAFKLPISGIVDEITLKVLNKEYDKLIKIFIDPGHGGHDPGAGAYNLREKEVALDIALMVSDVLMKNYIGISINMSRTTDKYLTLKERTDKANKWGADYFLSVHSNAGGGQGFESYVHNNASKESRDKQKDVHDYLVEKLAWVDRGKKKANFHVLRESNMPAILLEVLFIDNKQDNDLLRQSSYRKKVGKTIAEALAKALNLKQR